MTTNQSGLGLTEVASPASCEGRAGVVYRPVVDIEELAEGYVIRAEVPGVRADDVDLSVEKGLLALRGRVRPRHVGDGVRALRQEFGVGDYVRTFRLPESVDASRIEASLDLGVLTIRLGKSSSAVARKIAVESGNSE